MSDSYLTLDKSAHTEIKIKGSRFIGFVSPAKDKQEAEQIISERSKTYYDATHNCYAYVIGLDPSIQFRYNDDGEPSGTAGKPILDMIQGRNLTQVVCVVTRYFGGTKLGTGGLVRAYGQCARETLDASRIVEQFQMKRISLRFPYDLTGSVMTILSKYHATIQTTQYGDETELAVDVRISHCSILTETLQENTGGRILIQNK
ncbi:YigZ family protein [candidate division KSB1 bacterium]|nr:YigZ family protein [candidate division KSB1 bacterium]